MGLSLPEFMALAHPDNKEFHKKFDKAFEKRFRKQRKNKKVFSEEDFRKVNAKVFSTNKKANWFTKIIKKLKGE